MDGNLLLIIPSVLAETPDGVLLDEHFGNNLRAYLSSFEKVTVACPAIRPGANMIPLGKIAGAERCSIIVLPEPYREDRFYRNYARVSRLLRAQIEAADYLLISPHAAFDWSTLATRIAIAMGRDYNMEGDWNLQNVVRSQLSEMPVGPMRLRRTLWHHVHTHYYLDSMRKSRLSLLQGAAVFDAYKDVAPNPHKVFNIQVTPADRISDEVFAKKVIRVRSGAPLRIIYVGRAIAMKGPDDWQQCLQRAFAGGLKATATWVGEGDMLNRLHASAAERGLSEKISYPGNVKRDVAFQTLRDADIFLFCHLTDESPRCLIEALTAGTPIVGYGSLYAGDLVAERGGGEFVSPGDWQTLAGRLIQLDRHRERLANLLEAARASSLLYDRDAAIADRIRLMREHLRPPVKLSESGARSNVAARFALGTFPPRPEPKTMSDSLLPVIVSIATLPSRIAHLRPTLDSLLNGELVPDKILVLRSDFSEREKSEYVIPDFLNDKNFGRNIIEVKVTRDMGPGTKILGAMDHLPQECYLVLADDDVVYHQSFLKNIVMAQAFSPDCSFSYYTYRASGLTLGQGCDGFSFHSPSLRGIQHFADKYVVGTTLLYHDDLWISFFLFAKGIVVRTVPTPVHGETVYTQLIPNDGLSSLTTGNLARDRIVTDNLPRLIRQSNLSFGRRMVLKTRLIHDSVRQLGPRLLARIRRGRSTA